MCPWVNIPNHKINKNNVSEFNYAGVGCYGQLGGMKITVLAREADVCGAEWWVMGAIA